MQAAEPRECIINQIIARKPSISKNPRCSAPSAENTKAKLWKTPSCFWLLSIQRGKVFNQQLKTCPGSHRMNTNQTWLVMLFECVLRNGLWYRNPGWEAQTSRFGGVLRRPLAIPYLSWTLPYHTLPCHTLPYLTLEVPTSRCPWTIFLYIHLYVYNILQKIHRLLCDLWDLSYGLQVCSDAGVGSSRSSYSCTPKIICDLYHVHYIKETI